MKKIPSIVLMVRRGRTERESQVLERFGMRCAEARGVMGLTQTEVARRVGVSAARISLLETGATSPSLLVLLALARAIEIDLGSLLRDL